MSTHFCNLRKWSQQPTVCLSLPCDAPCGRETHNTHSTIKCLDWAGPCTLSSRGPSTPRASPGKGVSPEEVTHSGSVPLIWYVPSQICFDYYNIKSWWCPPTTHHLHKTPLPPSFSPGPLFWICKVDLWAEHSSGSYQAYQHASSCPGVPSLKFSCHHQPWEEKRGKHSPLHDTVGETKAQNRFIVCLRISMIKYQSPEINPGSCYSSSATRPFLLGALWLPREQSGVFIGCGSPGTFVPPWTAWRIISTCHNVAHCLRHQLASVRGFLFAQL